MEFERVASEAKRVVVAMSGGVDSAAAALLLAEAGYQVVGVAMQVWDYRKNGGSDSRRSCCAPADFDDARRIADYGGFPFYVFDFEDSFNDSVIRPFVKSYLQGYTPNPCIDCNRKVKFRELRARAKALGIPQVATGHYAQVRPKNDGTLGLYTSADDQKDQSYFLFGLTQADLKSTLFPVGDLRKEQVRKFLRDRGLEIASKSESQDICFVSGSVAEFVKKHSGSEIAHGVIKSLEGEEIGTHSGVHNFTVGQRKGLRVSHPSPLYVLDIHPESQTVVVGEKEELRKETFMVSDVTWVSDEGVLGKVSTTKCRVYAKLRYRHGGVLCELEDFGDGRIKAKFVDSWTPVSPGQAAVFYAEHLENDGSRELLGGGIIEREESFL